MKQIICSGGIFLAKDTKRFLFLLRTQGRTAGTWGLAGGKKDPTDVTHIDTLNREIVEELGFLPDIKKYVPLEYYSSKDDTFYYNTYVLLVDKEFVPVLNEEHSGYAWVSNDNWPKPLHNGLKTTLASRTTKVKIQTILDLVG
jgi:hypothetical protein